MSAFSEMQSAASTLFSAYASLAASMMLIRSMANDIVPSSVRSYIDSAIHYLFTPLSTQLIIVIDEHVGIPRNQVYEAAEVYLRTRISPNSERFKVHKTSKQKHLNASIEKNEEVLDTYENVKLKWRFVSIEPQNNNYNSDKKFFELSFNKKFKDKVLNEYLPYVLEKYKEIKQTDKVVKLYTRDCPYDGEDDGCGGGGGGVWGCINLEHPATFETLAMDADKKKAIIDDLDRFVRRKEFYKKVGKAWKRGYLLYGPPGTGKSSLIAAMANYLNFDVYDLELTSLYSNSELRRILISTTNRSIVVIEDIDCSVEMHDRQLMNEPPSNTRLTLSGLLNFIDGLWSSCGDERIIVFTTNHKDRLDPALLRPGRMDMHIHMSYCTNQGFKLLAFNYLDIKDNHRLFPEIEGLIENVQVTPAEVAEELMKSEDADTALSGLLNFLKRKKTEADENKDEKTIALEPNINVEDEEPEREAKRTRPEKIVKGTLRNCRRRMPRVATRVGRGGRLRGITYF